MADRDPERLLSQALRAQAQASLPVRPPADRSPRPGPVPAARPALQVKWVLLLALLLGLLAGATAGLVTVL